MPQPKLAATAAVLIVAIGAVDARRAEAEPPAARVLLTSVTERLPARPHRSDAERAEYLRDVRAWYEAPSSEWPRPHLDAGVEHQELGPVPTRPVGPDRDAARAKAALGKQLFFDPRLSGSGQLACASCHDPDLGWADGRTVSFGHNRRRLARNSPSILNSGLRKSLFWDGRAPSLEQQAKDVLGNADEMHSGDDAVVENLLAVPEYIATFERLYGVETPTIDEVADAIAAFERSVAGTNSKFDAFLRGRHAAMTDEQLSGLHLFRTDARCLNCHSGPLLTDDKFHVIGLSMFGRPMEDLGRYTVTGEAADVGAFRTPSLRDVMRTRPYMHSGLFDLDEVLRLYNAGMPNERTTRRDGRSTPAPIKSPHVKSLGLNDEDLADLEAFLGALTESNRRVPPPELPPGL